MKDLDNYIKEITTKEPIDYDDIDKIVLDHCYIHYKFNYRLVTESTIYEESTSKFPGQDELVKNILQQLKEYTDTQIININNKIIKSIYIHFITNDENKMSGGYVYGNEKYDDYNEVRWDNENKQFRFAEINIYNYEIDKEGLEEILYHETKHLWDDYQLMLHNKINLYNINKQQKSKDDIIDDILYYSNKYEISAYLSQLNAILGNKKYNSIRDALDDIIKSSIYKNYKEIYYVIINDLYKDELLKEITNKKYNQIKKNIQEAWHKIIHHIYIICGEHINENRMIPTTRKHLFKILNLTKIYINKD